MITIKSLHCLRFSQREIEAKVTSFRNLLLVRAGAGLAAANSSLLANNALAAAAVVAHQLQSFTQKPSNAILNMRLHNQLQNQRIANAIITNSVPSR